MLSFCKKRWLAVLTAALLMLSTCHWLLLASDQYVSEARIVVQKTDLPSGQSMDFSNFFGGLGAGNRADQMLLRDHLLSIDMLRVLDRELNLRAHYSDTRRDWVSRLWFPDATIEELQRHHLNRISVEFDEYSGVLMIRAKAYEQRIAQAIVLILLREGESFMNQMAHNLAQAQVGFLEEQVDTMRTRALAARQAVLSYQDKKGIVAPQMTATAISANIARLEAQRSELEIQRRAMAAYLVPDHPNLVMLVQNIRAVDAEISAENAKLTTGSTKALNHSVEAFQRLEMEATFAQDVLRTSLVALEKGRVEATRIIKKISILQTPVLPEYALEPKRIYNAALWGVVILLLAGIGSLLRSVINDHAD